MTVETGKPDAPSPPKTRESAKAFPRTLRLTSQNMQPNMNTKPDQSCTMNG